MEARGTLVFLREARQQTTASFNVVVPSTLLRPTNALRSKISRVWSLQLTAFQDNQIWQNLACCLSKSNNKEPVIQCFTLAYHSVVPRMPTLKPRGFIQRLRIQESSHSAFSAPILDRLWAQPHAPKLKDYLIINHSVFKSICLNLSIIS